LRKERKLKKHRRVDKGVQTGRSGSKTRSGRGERIQKDGATREIHGKVVVWME